MKDIINIKWREKQKKLPGFNCIAYPDGTVTLLNVFEYVNSETGKTSAIHIRPICDTTIDSIMKYKKNPWVEVDEWCVITNEDGHFLGGDGAMGNEGFIAKVDCNDNLIWAMFFTVTNPIKSLQITDDYLIGQNEHNDGSIKINLKQLTDIKYTKVV